MNLKTLSAVVSISAILTGCGTLGADFLGKSKPVSASPVPLPAAEPVVIQQRQGPIIEQAVTEPEPQDLWERIREQLSFHTIEHASVVAARKHYKRQTNYMPYVSQRAAPYLYHVVNEVEKRGMPIEIALLPILESTYSPFALSSQHAAGLWQIMPGTGRDLGLKQDWWFDGRRDVRESTTAALNYLQELHDDLDNDWLLALAAYNSGKGRVLRAMKANRKKGLATDYWSLKLPRETQRYVPRLVALSGFVAFPDIWKVRLPPIPNEPTFEIVDTLGQIELAKAADLAQVDLITLRAYNPGHLRWATDPARKQELLVPVGTGDRLAEAVAELTPDDRVEWQHYRIKRGDSLSRIAKSFGTQINLIREVNHIKGSRIRAGDTLMIPNGQAWENSLALASSSTTRTRRGYKVRRGDSLYRIAGRFKVSIDELVTWNSLNPRAYLKPGQKLTLYVSDS
ncbi:MAG: LysM peptidoglycan-binding domain-containing protein [Halioglobus sp.]